MEITGIHQTCNIIRTLALLISLMGFCYTTKRKASNDTAGSSLNTKICRNQDECYICKDTFELTMQTRKTPILSNNTRKIFKCGNSKCHYNFHPSCFINEWYKTEGCPGCFTECPKKVAFEGIRTELKDLITFLSTLLPDEVDGKVLLRYFSRFNGQPLELLCMIFADIDVSLYKITLFKERINRFDGLEHNGTLYNIKLILEEFIKVYKCLLEGAIYEENDKFLSQLIPLLFSDKLFYLGFLERPMYNHSPEALCLKLHAAAHTMKYIDDTDMKLKHAYDYISFSAFKSSMHKDSLLELKEQPAPVSISDIMPYDRYLSMWSFEFNPGCKLVRITIHYNKESDQITILLTPMLFGILDKTDFKRYISQKTDVNIGKWNAMLEALKELCMRLAERIRSDSGAEIEDRGSIISLIMRNSKSLNFEVLKQSFARNILQLDDTRINELLDLFRFGASCSKIICMNAASISSINFVSDQEFLELLFRFNNCNYIKQMIYIILHRRYLVFSNILTFLLTRYTRVHSETMQLDICCL